MANTDIYQAIADAAAGYTNEQMASDPYLMLGQGITSYKPTLSNPWANVGITLGQSLLGGIAQQGALSNQRDYQADALKQIQALQSGGQVSEEFSPFADKISIALGHQKLAKAEERSDELQKMIDALTMESAKDPETAITGVDKYAAVKEVLAAEKAALFGQAAPEPKAGADEAGKSLSTQMSEEVVSEPAPPQARPVEIKPTIDPSIAALPSTETKTALSEVTEKNFGERVKKRILEDKIPYNEAKALSMKEEEQKLQKQGKEEDDWYEKLDSQSKTKLNTSVGITKKLYSIGEDLEKLNQNALSFQASKINPKADAYKALAKVDQLLAQVARLGGDVGNIANTEAVRIRKAIRGNPLTSSQDAAALLKQSAQLFKDIAFESVTTAKTGITEGGDALLEQLEAPFEGSGASGSTNSYEIRTLPNGQRVKVLLGQ